MTGRFRAAVASALAATIMFPAVAIPATASAFASVRTDVGFSPTVSAEVLTKDTDAVSATVRELGGVVVGAVDGELVQVRVPLAKVGALARAPGVEFVQAPRDVTRPVTQSQLPDVGPGVGGTVGSNVLLTNAQAWQAAGVDGSVKVGIIDYFDRKLWNPAEEGPVPDQAHIFCQDTTAFDSVCSERFQDGLNNGDGFEHGIAVAQVIKDMAPAAELYLATVATASDLRAAIDWFSQNNVPIVTRSLGAAYDGAGDGTGPLDSVVDYAASLGITWFNSAGNDGLDGYVRATVPASLDYPGTRDDGYVDFDKGPGVDTFLRVNGNCYTQLDGVRWSDWNLPVAQRSDYSVEVYEPLTDPDATHRVAHPFDPALTLGDENYNPTDLLLLTTIDSDQSRGAPPLEAAGSEICPRNVFGTSQGITYLRIKRKAGTPVVGALDTLEVALGTGSIEHGRAQASYSAAKPIVDSANPMLVSVGAIDPALAEVNPNASALYPEAIAMYSSHGPTNDGRFKPDVSAPSCVASTVYTAASIPSCFNGTSAAAPTVAGMAALLLDAGLAVPGAPLAAAVKHFTFDRNVAQGNLLPIDGADNKYGVGQVLLPAVPPPAPAPSTSAYVPLVPRRVLDTRQASPVGAVELAGPHRPYDIIDLAVAGVADVAASATAVAVNITSVGASTDGYIQAVPYLRSAYGTSSTLNIAVPGEARPNFAIVPVGVDGKISIYTVPGGQIIVDVLGYFAPSAASVSAGRVVSITPQRVLDTRTTNLVPAGWSPHQPVGESVLVPAASAVPTTGVAALVLNVTATDAVGNGYLRAEPTGTLPSSSTVNYVAHLDSANSVIVPVGAYGMVSVFSSNAAHIVVDVTGYVTDSAAPVAAAGLFVPIVTARAYDSRNAGESALVAGVVRSVALAGLAAPLPSVPVGASAVSINLTTADEAGPGFVAAYPSGTVWPGTSSLNFQPGQPVANGSVLKLSPTGALDLFSNWQTHVIIDVNGYFT